MPTDTVAANDGAEAARDKIALVSHEAAVRLYDLLADRLRQYAALCGSGNAEARGDARTKIEALLPPDGWLGRLLAPSQGKVIGVRTCLESGRRACVTDVTSSSRQWTPSPHR